MQKLNKIIKKQSKKSAVHLRILKFHCFQKSKCGKSQNVIIYYMGRTQLLSIYTCGTKQVMCILSTHHVSQSEEFFVPQEDFSQVPSLSIF